MLGFMKPQILFPAPREPGTTVHTHLSFQQWRGGDRDQEFKVSLGYRNNKQNPNTQHRKLIPF